MFGLSGFLEIATVLVCGAFVLVALCARFGLPGILGYLLAGLLIGPSGLGVIAEGEALVVIGEIGVILLLFTLGLEFSLEKLLSLGRLIFGLGAAQVVLTAGLMTAILSAVTDIGLVPAIMVGAAVAMSSTALCLRVLAGARALGSSPARIVIAILLFQDLAAVAFLLIHDAATVGGEEYSFITLFGGAGALVAALVAARGPLHWLARWVRTLGDPELAQLLALAIALAAAIAAVRSGLSPALGAFAAGMLISEGDARHVVEKEIRPFRDLFVGIFFISIGTQMHIQDLFHAWPEVVFWLFVLTVAKFAFVVGLVRMFGTETGIALRAGLILAHGGEFSLMLLSIAMGSGLLDAALANPLLLAVGLSMILASGAIQRVAGDEPAPSNDPIR